MGGKWIICANKMPPEKTKVLCATKRHGMKIFALSPPGGEYKRETDWQGEVVGGILQRFQYEEVTHWMDLPEPPEITSRIERN